MRIIALHKVAGSIGILQGDYPASEKECGMLTDGSSRTWTGGGDSCRSAASLSVNVLTHFNSLKDKQYGSSGRYGFPYRIAATWDVRHGDFLEEFQCRSRNYQKVRRRLDRALGVEWAAHLPQTSGRKFGSHLVSIREEFQEGVVSSLDAATLRAPEQSDDNKRLVAAYRSNTDGITLGVNKNCGIGRNRNVTRKIRNGRRVARVR